MHALYHCWELGQKSWASFQRMLLVADQVTVWSPSHDQIAEACQNRGLAYTPEEFLELVDLGVVNVATRETWLSGPEYRNDLTQRGFKMAGWNDSFDGRLSKASRDLISVLPKPDVSEWVEEQCRIRSKQFIAAEDLVKKSKLDPEWLRVASIKNKLMNDDAVIRQALDTARHHFLAMSQLNCTTGVESWAAPSFFDTVGRKEDEPIPAGLNSVAPPPATLDLLIFEMNRARYLGGDRRDFNKHIDTLIRFKELGYHKLLQSDAPELPTEAKLLKDLKKKIQISLNKHDSRFGMAEYTKAAVPVLATGAATVIALADTAARMPSINRRNFITLLASAIVTTATGYHTVTGAIEASNSLEPSIDLAPIEQALYLMVNGEHTSSLQVDLAELLVSEVEAFSKLYNAT
ncbi:hypothetical protein [Peteryoungia algae]|uniref:Uncharacterized protein n=1 Tax=Peteryoungia algae TaxID=2919917 RepID=A0ABT0D240_9HYPH|nr:hypothetical protein [Rhizobium sp. SSM4.3]MCJ8239384.1 hypothetical protein [Rhizobium sp. SSM4.3]